MAENAVRAVHVEVGGERWELWEKRNNDLLIILRAAMGGGVVQTFADLGIGVE